MYQDGILILNIYAPNSQVPTLAKETSLKLTIHNEPHIIIVGNFNNVLSSIDKSSRQKLHREIMELTHIMTQVDLIDICRTPPLKYKRHTFFLAPQGTFSKIDHMLGHIASLNRHKKIEITSCI